MQCRTVEMQKQQARDILLVCHATQDDTLNNRVIHCQVKQLHGRIIQQGLKNEYEGAED